MPGRIIDVSRAAAEDLGFLSAGVTDVRVEVVTEVATRPVDTAAKSQAVAPQEEEAQAVEPAQEKTAAKAEVERETKSPADSGEEISIGQAVDNLDRDFSRVMDALFGADEG